MANGRVHNVSLNLALLYVIYCEKGLSIRRAYRKFIFYSSRKYRHSRHVLEESYCDEARLTGVGNWFPAHEPTVEALQIFIEF